MTADSDRHTQKGEHGCFHLEENPRKPVIKQILHSMFFLYDGLCYSNTHTMNSTRTQAHTHLTPQAAVWIRAEAKQQHPQLEANDLMVEFTPGSELPDPGAPLSHAGVGLGRFRQGGVSLINTTSLESSSCVVQPPAHTF